MNSKQYDFRCHWAILRNTLYCFIIFSMQTFLTSRFRSICIMNTCLLLLFKVCRGFVSWVWNYRLCCSFSFCSMTLMLLYFKIYSISLKRRKDTGKLVKSFFFKTMFLMFRNFCHPLKTWIINTNMKTVTQAAIAFLCVQYALFTLVTLVIKQKKNVTDGKYIGFMQKQ